MKIESTIRFSFEIYSTDKKEVKKKVERLLAKLKDDVGTLLVDEYFNGIENPKILN